MSRYTYHGPVQGITLTIQGKAQEHLLQPGRTYELPADHPVIAGLLAAQMLSEAATEPDPVKSKRGKAAASVDDAPAAADITEPTHETE